MALLGLAAVLLLGRLQLAARADERAAALGRRQCRVPASRRQSQRRRRKRPRAGRAVRRRQALGRVRLRRPARNARPPGPPRRKDSTLLDEIDLLAGVSGGSFPAAYYGLYGEKSFDTFPDDFLYRDIEAYIWGTFLLPWNWDWIFNPLVGTNDRMTQVYDRLMFHGATFADLYRRGRPQVSINATDIGFGTPFGFLPQTFDVICSDLSALPIARAVAASNGFPVLFGPVTLRNYRGPDCPFPSPVPPDAWDRAEGDLRRAH